ncbi:hypothetical protein BV898_01407 [Hypsibius exemplaris]|uniref:Receptor ligand binding region domain-containing protein n=1 Tax=Hypsibius exemplaris TaxID=2072580 RepID=A0A1W0XBD2_HYPEX|nr:hypothetical protein BV898_01407 [Hypsibius exemplaris]
MLYYSAVVWELLLLPELCDASSSLGALDIEIISPASMTVKQFGGLPFVGPAFNLAVTDVRRQFPKLNVTQKFIVGFNESLSDGECGENDVLLTEYYYRRRLDTLHGRQRRWTLFIYSGCGVGLTSNLQIATGLNKVVIISGVSSPYVTEKAAFPTILTTVLSPISPASYATVVKLVQFYGWTTVIVVTEIGGVNTGYEIGGRAVYSLLRAAIPPIDATFVPVSLTGNVATSVLVALLEQFRATSRIMFLSADSLPANKLLIQARLQGMTDGSYVYLITSALTLPYDGSRLRNVSNEYHFKEARHSYSSCLMVALGIDHQFVQGLAVADSNPYVNIWKATSQSEYNYTYPANKRPTLHVASAYAAVTIVAQVGTFAFPKATILGYYIHQLHERFKVADQLRRQEPPFDFDDGALLARQFFNRTFQTNVGNLTLNHVGQRIPQTLVGYYDPDKDVFVPYLVYEPTSDSSTFESLQQSRWLNGPWPVPSEPLCGFSGLRCKTSNMLIMIITGIAVGGIATCLCIYCVIQRFFYYQRLHQLWWNLDPNLLMQMEQWRRQQAKSALGRFGAILCVGSVRALD